MSVELATWKPVPGYEGEYEVSSDGSVRSLDREHLCRGGTRRVKGRTLRPCLAKGYQYVGLRKRERAYVHRLVLEAFTGPCPEGFQACHNDGDRLNNRVENLRWDTLDANAKDRIRHGTQVRGERQHNAKLSAPLVVEIRRLLASGRPQGSVSRLFGVSQSTICDINRGVSWKHVEATV